MANNSQIIVALDFADQHDALSLVDKIKPEQCRLKVGKEMFTYFGPQFVGKLVDKGFDVFLDLKFHDIPATTAKACVAAANLGVWMVNVHTSGGEVMMSTAQEALQGLSGRKPLLIGVTVLTSMDQSDLNGLGIQKTPQEQVLSLATLAAKSGLDGVVCSAQEAIMLKQALGQDFKLVTPGIRPAGSDKGDQKRIMTPEQAVKDGADYLVIGRPITQAQDPYAVLEQINLSLKG
ncbi:orotidine-5'-phosphate decarboxylase [Saccharobesus litoralis]|uniref:Orotidine 5'-phosphate decarboxylase n=1 Tax=Saccharobesus litoralis TaxID=2172099 RepID=A0A2S0VP09_9ALTE|nr:orotidine-5'-phosphate decarboxylase [Saccharobesus litoralis]AWB65955.1 orotidine-5'-phosphate decarboxylase [Saccharobesus litoralis]